MSFTADNFDNAPVVRPIPSHPGYFASTDGKIYSRLSGSVMRELKPGPGGRDGRYQYVSLGQDCKDGVHELIALTFFPMPANVDGTALVVRHLDGRTKNNAARNLAYGSQSDNMMDRRQHGTAPLGTKHHAAKLSDADVLTIRQRRAAGEAYPKIAADFGICREQARRIALGEYWSHLPGVTA